LKPQEIGAFFMDINEQIDFSIRNSTAFCVYKLPGTSTPIQLTNKPYKLHNSINEVGKNLFVFHPFETNCNPIIALYETGDRDLAMKESQEKSSHFAEKEQYKNEAEKAIHTIQHTELQKVVLSRRIKKEQKTTFNWTLFFEKLCRNYPFAFNYIFYSPHSGIWAGASPEVLIRKQENHYLLYSLAGTRNSNELAYNPFTEKEKQEQKIVTDYILQRLKKANIHNVECSEQELFYAGPVCHLVQYIKVYHSLSKTELRDLLLQLHPTPAVCGTPKNEALAFIQNNEPVNREYYTGFLGRMNFDEFDLSLFVNLRCLTFRDNCFEIFVGGGITKDSKAEDEWLETENKAKTLLNIINEVNSA
jgi:isochorismate synthase